MAASLLRKSDQLVGWLFQIAEMAEVAWSLPVAEAAEADVPFERCGEARFEQHLQVVTDGWLGQLEWLGEVTDACLAARLGLDQAEQP